MLQIEIPGREPLTVSHVVLDYNGTVALDGALLPGVAERIAQLAQCVAVHILTADTHGTAARQCAGLNVSLQTFPQAGAASCKAAIVRALSGGVVCFGNGFNDIPMFDAAALSVAVLGQEGLCAALLPHAAVVVTDIMDGLDLLLKPDRLRATLRS